MVLIEEKAGVNICSSYAIMFTGVLIVLLTIYDGAFVPKKVHSFSPQKRNIFFLLLHYNNIRLNFLSYLFIYYRITQKYNKNNKQKEKLCHEPNMN